MKKLLCLLACSLGLAAAATGCAMSPERLCTRVQQAVAETPATSADMEADITMTFTDPETGIQVDADGSYQITSRVTRDPKASQLSMDAQVEVMGVTVPVTVESYTLVEDGMLTTYTGVDGLWQRFTARDIDLQEAAPLWEQPADQLTIDREQEGWDGHVGFVPNFVKELNPDVGMTVVLCGPPVMIKFTLQGLKELGFQETQVYTTMELRMKCGVGKCGRCNIGSKYVCKDGPVFRFDQLDELPNEY